MTITFDSVGSLDPSTVTHSALVGDMTYADGEFLLNFLYTRDTTSQSPAETSGVWVGDLVTFIGAFASPFRFGFGYYRPRADNSGDDGHTWEWTGGDVEASSVALAAHQQLLEYWQSDYNDNADATVDTSIGSAEGCVTVLFLLSPTGTTCNADSLIIRTDGPSMPAGHGTVEAWAYQGPGPHTVDADALTGNIDFYYWVELRDGRWHVGFVGQR